MPYYENVRGEIISVQKLTRLHDDHQLHAACFVVKCSCGVNVEADDVDEALEKFGTHRADSIGYPLVPTSSCDD